MEKNEWTEWQMNIYAKKIGKERDFSTNPEFLEEDPKISVIVSLARREIGLLMGMSKEWQHIYFEKKYKQDLLSSLQKTDE